MTAVEVDRELCQNHGQCVYAAPAVFAFDDDEDLVYDPAPEAAHDQGVLVAAEACPVRAITVTLGGAASDASPAQTRPEGEPR